MQGRKGVVVSECAGVVIQAMKVSGSMYQLDNDARRGVRQDVGAPAIHEASPPNHTVQLKRVMIGV